MKRGYRLRDPLKPSDDIGHLVNHGIPTLKKGYKKGKKK